MRRAVPGLLDGVDDDQAGNGDVRPADGLGVRADAGTFRLYHRTRLCRQPLDLVPDRFRVDLSAMWRDVNQVWSVRVFVQNATDEANLRDIGSANEFSNWRLTGALLTPRVYGVDVRYNFGG